MSLTLPELLALPPAETMVLSPSDRARRAWRERWPNLMRSSGTAVLPTFLTLDEWLALLWEDLRLLGRLRGAGELLDDAVEQALWQRAAREQVGGSVVESERIGQEMQAAWRLANAYAEAPRPEPGVTIPTAGWAGRVDLRIGEAWWQAAAARVLDQLDARGAVSAAELARRLRARVASLAGVVTRHLILTPQFSPWPDVAALLEAIEASGVAHVHRLPEVGVPDRQADPPPLERYLFRDLTSERDAALAWAAERAERARAGGALAPRVVIVVPDLAASFGLWRRSADMLAIDANFSLGPAVSRYPWAAAGFVAVSAAFEPGAIEEVVDALAHSRWGWPPDARMRLAAAAREAIETGVRHWCLREALERAGERRRSEAVAAALEDFSAQVRRTRAQWAARYAALIRVLTDAPPTLDSSLVQLQDALLTAIDRWCALDAWLPPVTHAEGHAELMRLTDRTPFQPEGHGQSVQVIGLLESAGLPHDGLWFANASIEHLPERVRLNLALDPAWQRRHGVGLATPGRAWARGRALVQHWRALGPIAVASRAETEEATAGGWSALLSDWPAPQPATSPTRESASPIEWIADEAARPDPPLDRADTAALQAQAICPRRGLLQGRLGLEPWPLAPEGVPPQLRGQLLHGLAERYGRAVDGRDSRQLDWGALARAIPGWVVETMAAWSVDLARLPRAVVAAEQRRMERIMRRFLAQEQGRIGFRVTAVERSQTVGIGPLALGVKMDRIDCVLGADPARNLLIIDYKTGRADSAGLTDERLTAPQLPIYAQALGEATAGVAYAPLTDDSVEHTGLGWGWQAAGATPPDPSAFEATRTRWAHQLSRLATDYAAGEAALAPADGLATCDRCPVRPGCGIDRALAASGALLVGDEDA